MSTPSRVTRSSSRQPERSPRARTPARSSSGASSSKKKSTTSTASGSTKKVAPSSSNKKTASSKKKASSSAKEAAEDAVDTVRRTASSTARAAKAAAADASERVREYAEEYSHEVTRSVSRTTGKARQLLGDALDSDKPLLRRIADPEDSSRPVRRRSISSNAVGRAVKKAVQNAEEEASASPVIALVPQVALYAALVGLAHTLVLFFFAKQSLQLKQADFLSRLSLGFFGVDSIKHWLLTTNEHHVALWLVVPLYLGAGMLLRQGVAHVLGARRQTQALAANIARVVSAIFFVLTVAGYTEWDQHNSVEGLNPLSVLQFSFMLQEFLLNFPRFSGARFAYSVLYLALTGWQSVQAYNFRATVLTSPQAEPLQVALAYALFVVNTSDNLAALAGAFAGLRCPRLAVVYQALQSVVNFGLLPVMAIAVYQKHGALFPDRSELKQPSFLESSAAAGVMCALTFLLVVDSYQATITRFASKRKAQ